MKIVIHIIFYNICNHGLQFVSNICEAIHERWNNCVMALHHHIHIHATAQITIE